MNIKNIIKLEFKLLFSRKEFLYTFSAMMILVCLAFLLKCFALYGRDISLVYPASQLWFGWLPAISSAKPITGLFYMFVLPFAASVVYSDTYYIDFKTGVVKNIITRCEKSQYLLAKGIVIFISGFIVIFIPLVFEQIFCLFASPIRGGLDLTHWPAYTSPLTEYLQFGGLYVNHPYLRNFLLIVLSSWFGGGISLFSYALSYVNKKNRLFIVAAPGILYIIYNFIVEFVGVRSIGLMYYLYSSMTFSGSTTLYIVVLAGMVLLSSAIIFGKKIVSRDEL